MIMVISFSMVMVIFTGKDTVTQHRESKRGNYFVSYIKTLEIILDCTILNISCVLEKYTECVHFKQVHCYNDLEISYN